MSDSEDADAAEYISCSESEDEEENPHSWRYVSDENTQVHVDDVDELLLAKARLEVDCVVKGLLQRMFGTSQHHLEGVGVARFLFTWLDSSVLAKLCSFANRNLGDFEAVSTNDVLQFLEVEMWLSFYGVTPEFFYDLRNRAQYPPAKRTMALPRYQSILAALSTSPDDRGGGASNLWTAPFTPDRDLSHAAELVSRICADIGFVDGVTIASLDDDLIRLRSNAVDATGLARIRNPKKGYGPVQHGVVSLVTSLFLAGHIAANGELTVDIVRILQRTMCGSPTESHIRLPGILHALDRGYQSHAVNQQIVDAGGGIVGTHKRTARFPFTFAKQPSRFQRLVVEKGERGAYWATKRVPSSAGTLPVHAHALAYRSGLNKVALGYTTLASAGPGHWSYVSRPPERTSQTRQHLFSSFESGVQLLTVEQRTPEWFLLRKFRITGSVAAGIFKVIKRCTLDANNDTPDNPIADPDVQTVLLQLSLGTSRHRVHPVQERRTSSVQVGQSVFTEADLAKKNCEQLGSLCRDLSLRVSGNKTALINRLCGNAADEATSDQNTDVTPRSAISSALLSAWFMAPFSTPSTKLGTANESNIATHITQFLDTHTHYHIEALKAYGLLCKRGMPVAAFSPDHIASIVSVKCGRFSAVMEYKTRTTARTVQHERALSAVHGIFTTVNLASMGTGELLNTAIPELNHRLQILHSIVCGGVGDGFLVYATSSSIIRVVHVVVSSSASQTYCSALNAIARGYMGWVYTANSCIPDFDHSQYGHCVDQATLQQTLELWKALVNIIDERQGPLPPAKRITPTLIALWNKVKGGIDVYSRYLKNVKSKHFRLLPTGAIWLRMMMTLVYNAHQSYMLFQSRGFLMNRSLCTSFKSYQAFKQKLPRFQAFCREAALALSERVSAARPLGISADQNIEPVAATLERSFAYNKRIRFETEKEWIDVRLSKTADHHAVRINDATQRCCIVCCQLNHDSENSGHTRKGFKTSFECDTCKVTLCRTARWNGGESCFEKFHAQRKLPNPCKDPEAYKSTKANENRAPPPSRKRSMSLDPPNRRAPSVRLANKQRRRSLRLQSTAKVANQVNQILS